MTGARPADPGTSIIGRDDELRAVAEAFATGARLVTLVGLGGIGKTTIALACSARRQHAESASGQTVFVDLAPLTDPSDVLTTIGAALGLTGSSAALLEEAVVRELRRSTPLLILDNFESVRAASRLVDRLMEAVPELTVLVTSRIAVGVRGEREVPVRALTVPTSTADLESAASGRLLLERAAERGGLRSSEAADREAMVEICRHLDGVPLAIELAAAWTRLLSPRAIVRRLVDDRLDLTVPDGGRHAGMDRVVDSTLALIMPEDRKAFEALAIFPAPFDEDDASAVLDAEDVLAVLRRLEAIGLIQPQVDPDGEPRFRILEPVRAVAAARLGRRPDLREIEARFVAAAASRSQLAADRLRDVRPGRALDWMTAEGPNLRSALRIATERGDATHAVQLAMTLGTYGVRAGNARESLERVRAALTVGPVPPEIRSEALCAIANLCVVTRDEADPVPICQEAVELARASGDPRREVRALIALGSYGPPEQTVATLTDAMELARRTGYAWAELAAIDNLASFRADRGEWTASLALRERSLETARRVGDVDGIGYVSSGMADALIRLGRADEAYKHAVDASSMNRRAWPQSHVLAWSLAVQATTEVATGRGAAALGTLAEACAVAISNASEAAAIDVLDAAAIAFAGSRPALAARIVGKLEAADPAAARSRALHPSFAAAVVRAEAALGRRRFEREHRDGGAAGLWSLLAAVAAGVAEERQVASSVSADFGRLTRRETEILTLLAAGRTDPEIGASLGMSPKTASVHVANIKGKLGAATRVDAAIRARALLAATERDA